jgi:hypothetical protein
MCALCMCVLVEVSMEQGIQLHASSCGLGVPGQSLGSRGEGEEGGREGGGGVRSGELGVASIGFLGAGACDEGFLEAVGLVWVLMKILWF